METEHNPQLTAAEQSQIWAAYQNDTLIVCVLKYFLNHVNDEQIRSIIQQGLDNSRSHIEKLSSFFTDNGHTIPQGFTDNDVDVDAPKLYSDTYMLLYMKQVGVLGLNAYSVALALAARKDIQSYFSDCISETDSLLQWANDILLSKGLFTRSAYLPLHEKVDFVDSQQWLKGWFTERRPLTALEITNLYDNIQRNAIGVATLTGFSQAANSKEIGEYMVKGKEIAAKHIEIFSSVLSEQDLPAAQAWTSEVTDSTGSPFSDKLLMFHTTSLTAIGMGYYGTSLSTTMRRDLSTHYTRLLAEVGKYAQEGAKIMIKHGWMEEPPTAANRRNLANN